MFKYQEYFVAFTLAILCIFAGIQARSISQLGDITIDIDNGKIQCDKIECPVNTTLCVVTKEKPSPNSTVLMRKDTCYSATKEVLKNHVINETIDANTDINVHLEATANGLTTISNSYNSYSSSNFDSDKFNKEMHQIEETVEKNMKDMNDYMHNLFKDIFG